MSAPAFANTAADLYSVYPTESFFGVTTLKKLEPGISVSVTPFCLVPNPFPYSVAMRAMVVAQAPNLLTVLHMGWSAEDAGVLFRAIASGLYK
jgi:hypothetical protein